MRILFVKTSSLGDVIHHCPAVTDARRRFPHALIDWVIEEPFAEIARLHPAVRQVIPVAVRRWRAQVYRPSVWLEIIDFHRAIRAEHYDVVIDTQGLLKSALIASRSYGVKHGYDFKSAREPLASRFYDTVHCVSRDMHAVERNRTLTAAAFGTAVSEACDYGLVPLPQLPAPWTKPFCVLLSMTSRADKLWPEAHWALLAKALEARGLLSVFPWGTDAEHRRCERIVHLAGAGVVADRMSLSRIAFVLSQARMVLGVDTGLTHLAAALNVPVVGMYVGSDPILTGLHGQGKMMNLGGLKSMPSVEDVLLAATAVA